MVEDKLALQKKYTEEHSAFQAPPRPPPPSPPPSLSLSPPFFVALSPSRSLSYPVSLARSFSLPLSPSHFRSLPLSPAPSFAGSLPPSLHLSLPPSLYVSPPIPFICKVTQPQKARVAGAVREGSARAHPLSLTHTLSHTHTHTHTHTLSLSHTPSRIHTHIHIHTPSLSRTKGARCRSGQRVFCARPRSNSKAPTTLSLSHYTHLPLSLPLSLHPSLPPSLELSLSLSLSHSLSHTGRSVKSLNRKGHALQERSESVLRAAQEQFEGANNAMIARYVPPTEAGCQGLSTFLIGRDKGTHDTRGL